MTAYFSESLHGFIPENWRTDGTYSNESWPSDAVLLTPDEVEHYWKVSPPVGKHLGTTGDGRPCWVDIPPPSHEELVSQAESKRSQLAEDAEQSIRPLERAKNLSIATDVELASLTEWERYSVFLIRVDTSKAPDITWPIIPTV